MVLVTCTSSKAANSSLLAEYVQTLAEHVLRRAPKDVSELAAQDWIAGGPSVAHVQRRFADQLDAGLAVSRIVRLEVETGWVHPWRAPNGDGVLLAVRSEGTTPRASLALSKLAEQIRGECAWDVELGEDGISEVFEPLTVVDRPWSRDARTTVQAEMERLLGAPWSLTGYACYRLP
jgi:hypothetical protein